MPIIQRFRVSSLWARIQHLLWPSPKFMVLVVQGGDMEGHNNETLDSNHSTPGPQAGLKYWEQCGSSSKENAAATETRATET
jgi:hypothetical protein